MQIKEIGIDKINVYENNPRINDKAVKYVANSIKKFGFKNPIIIDKNNIIVAGHTRYLASKKLGLKNVPCIIADDLTEKQIKAFRLADNKVSEFSQWDNDLLDLELGELSDLDIDMSEFGFDVDDIDFLEQEIIEDDIPDIPQEPKAKYGDIYELGKHRLMCGDSTNTDDIEKLMNGVKADLVITDPPYNVSYEGCTDEKLTIMNDIMSNDEFKKFLKSAFKCIYAVLKEGGCYYVWYADVEQINFATSLNEVGLKIRQQLIWNKNTITFSHKDYHWKHESCLYGWKEGKKHNWYNDRKQTTVLDFDKPNRNREHPTMKPIDLISYLVNNSSKKDDVVLDSFGGSGSTLIACEQLNRKCYMMELDPKYVDVIIDRWEKFTGKEAVKINEWF